MKEKIPDDFRGFIYEPSNEQEVVSLFFRIEPYLELNLCFDEIRTNFPDCIARRKTSEGWEKVNIEFEHLSHNFVIHGHDEEKCDMIICWQDNWSNCPLEVIELIKEIEKLDREIILKDRPKFTKTVWNREKFLERVKEHYPDLLEYQKKAFKVLDDRNVYISEGEGPKIASYNFKIPSEGKDETAGIYADGRIWMQFSNLTEEEKTKIVNKLKRKLDLEFSTEKEWTFIGNFKENIGLDDINELVTILIDK